jgi:hypothetical protein
MLRIEPELDADRERHRAGAGGDYPGDAQVARGGSQPGGATVVAGGRRHCCLGRMSILSSPTTSSARRSSARSRATRPRGSIAR